MLKQFISIVLIFTVNILFLTHAVVLHHHHHEIPYFSFLETENYTQQRDNSCCSHDEKKDKDTCQLEQNIDVICETEKENCHCIICCTSHDHSDLLLQALLFHFNFAVEEIDEKLQQPPYLISYHSIVVSSNSGLRAPPHC